MRRAPSLSGSVMARYEACPSSYVREWEVENFVKHNQVEGVDAGEAAAQGTRLHDILKDLPFFSEKWGMGTRYAIRRRIDTLAEERGVTLRPGDGWFLYDSTRKRNALIESLIERAGGAAAVVEFNFDADRIRHTFDDAGHPVPVTMLPDVLVTATGPNGRHELFCDYKTGYLGVAKAGTNRQLLTGAALVDLRSKAKGISLDSVQVALLQRADAAPGLVDAVTFKRPQLDAAVKWLGQLAIDRDRWLRAYNSRRDAEGTPDAAMHDFLEKAAQPGDHCDHCKGGICCQKMQRTVGARMNLTTENTEGLLKFAHRKVKDSIKNIEAEEQTEPQPAFDPEKLPMNLETLSSTLAWSKALTEGAALPERVWKDAAELTRQLGARGVRPDGWGLKEGAKRFLFRDKLPLLTPDGEVATDETTRLPIHLPADTRPPAIYAALRDLIPAVPYAEFIDKACEVDPKKVQALLADAHNVDARQVYETVLCPLGARNPVEMRTNASTVVAVVQVSAEQEQATAEAGRAVIEGKSKKEAPLLPGDGESAKQKKTIKK